ncbi:unnamed protein product [Larinioides sclopetarius]|uniref:Uncharacterized protein n=1 Tax=Larinioides sclopetarius TaxID=280406 RepID=A0AAV1Z594_9ARAC
MDPSFQQGTVESGGGSVMAGTAFSWHGLSPIVRLQQSLIGNCYVQLLGDHLQPFMDFMYPNNDGIFWMTMHHATGPQLFVTRLKNILDSSS